MLHFGGPVTFNWTCHCNRSYRVNIYLLKVNNWNISKRCEVCSKLTIKTPERRQGRVFYILTSHDSSLVSKGHRIHKHKQTRLQTLKYLVETTQLNFLSTLNFQLIKKEAIEKNTKVIIRWCKVIIKGF